MPCALSALGELHPRFRVEQVRENGYQRSGTVAVRNENNRIATKGNVSPEDKRAPAIRHSHVSAAGRMNCRIFLFPCIAHLN
jgi:hypothetical protein